MSSKEWKKYKLRDLTTKIGSGATPRGGKDAYLESGDYSLIRSQNVLDFTFSYNGLAFINKAQATQLNNVTVAERDVLLNITGDSVARVCQVPNEALPARVNQHVAIIRPDNSKLLPEFLKYYLLNPSCKNQLLSFSAVGATRNALTKGMIEDIDIQLPTIKEQQRIASILSSLDDKIELNRQTNQTLEGIAQTLFQEMCVPRGEELPEGWRVGKLKEVVDIVMGQSPAGTSYNQNGEGVIFFQGKAEFGFRFPEIDKYTTEPKRYANKLDTLLSVRAPVGTINMASERCCIGRGLAAISGKNNCWSYAFHLSKSLSERFEMYNGEGTVFGSINKTDLENLELIIPTKNVIQEFEVKAEALDNLVFTNEQENQTLITLRDSLLPKLMKGEIEI